jgi:ABC-type branched-subunit amino acid transport system substrate-binding protein
VAAGLRAAREAVAAGELGKALGAYQRLLAAGVDGATAAWIDARVRSLLAKRSDAQLRRLSADLAVGSRVRGLLVLRRAQRYIAAGREDRARQLLSRRGAGLTAPEREALLAAAGRLDRVGALVPLSGRLRSLGRHIVQGMVLAAGILGRPSGRPMQVVVRDSARDGAAGAQALADAGVVGVVGLPLSSRARRLAPVLQRAGVPLLTGADGHGVPGLGSYVFRGVHAPSVRARALARWLAGTGKVQRVAVIHPVGGYGKRTGGAFAAEAKRLGLTVVGTVAYRRKDPALYKSFEPLAAKQPGAVFVADSAVKLEIVAPQLGLAGLQAAPLGKGGPKKTLLLSTAEGLRHRLVKNVGASVQGAVVAPGFYPDPRDPALSAFVQAYQRTYARPPGRYAALGYLAVLRLRSLLLRRARGRVSLRGALAGLTVGGKPRWNAQGERVDPPRLYRILGQSITRITRITSIPKRTRTGENP